jgi:hypothetical protein
MPMAVFCIAVTEFQAETIVNELKADGFANNDISVLFPDKSGTQDFGHEQRTKAPEGALLGAGALGIVGGGLGWLAGLGVLASAGTGPFATAGPFVAALAGVALGALIGGMIGAWLGTRVPEYVAKRYDGKLETGNILISVHARNSNRAIQVKDIFSDAGAQSIAMTNEAEVPTRRTGLIRQELHALN